MHSLIGKFLSSDKSGLRIPSEAPTRRQRFKEMLKFLFSFPDLHLSQFEQLERKRTPQQMQRERFY